MLSPASRGFGAIVGHYLSGLGRIYYVEGERINISNKSIIFVTYPGKLELKRYNELSGSFLEKNDYKLVEGRKFGDLLIEKYTKL
jgi:hypothetical protein